MNLAVCNANTSHNTTHDLLFLITDFDSYMIIFVCLFVFFLNTYRYIGLYLSFKIFMRISLFNFILPLHTKPL